MSESDMRWVYEQTVGDSKAKHVLAQIAFMPITSVKELAINCEMSTSQVIKSVNFLIEKGFIQQVKGSIPSSEKGEIYQFSLIKNK